METIQYYLSYSYSFLFYSILFYLFIYSFYYFVYVIYVLFILIHVFITNLFIDLYIYSFIYLTRFITTVYCGKIKKNIFICSCAFCCAFAESLCMYCVFVVNIYVQFMSCLIIDTSVHSCITNVQTVS